MFTDTLGSIAIIDAWEQSIRQGCTFPFRNLFWVVVSASRLTKRTKELDEAISDLDFLHAVLFTRIYGEPPEV